MFSRWPGLAVALALGLAFFIGNGSATAASATDVVVVSVKGDVQVTMRGTARTVRAGGIVELPANVRTGADGAIELQQGPTTVSVAANTQIEIPASGLGEPIDRVIQPQGSAFYNVGKRLGKKLRVETPYLVAVIKGTQFNVAVQGDGTTVSLFEGQLEVRAPDDSDVVNINAGEIAIRHATDKAIRVLRMDKTTPPAKPGDGSDRSGNALTSGRTPGTDGDSTPSPSARGADDSNTSRPAGPTVPGLNDVTAGTRDLDASINVSTRGEGGAGAAAVLEAGPAALGASADVDLGGGALDASTSLGAAVGGVTANVDGGAAVDLGSGSLAAGASAAVDLAGVATADVGVDAGVDLGAGTVNAGASVGVDSGAVNAGVTAGAALDTGSAAATVDLAATAPPVDVSAGTSIDVGAGTTSVDVGVGSLDLGLAVDLGAGSLDVGVGTTDTSTSPGTTTPDNGGLLGGLSGLLGKHR